MTLMEEKTLADHDINVRSIRQELRLLEEQLKKHEVTDIHTGYIGVDDDYPVSVKQVLNITAELGALETQRRVRELPRYQVTADTDTISRKPETTTEIQKILDYLDNELHPLVSPDNWNVYSELYDMVSELDNLPPSPSRQADWSKTDVWKAEHERVDA